MEITSPGSAVAGSFPCCRLSLRLLLRMVCALLLATVALGRAHAADDPPGRVGRVAELSGVGWMRHAAQGDEWFALSRNRPVTTGDRLATERAGRVELQVGSTSVLLGEASEVVVSRLDDERVELLLQRGTLALRLRQPEQIREWRLLTAEGYLAPSSTGLFRLDRDERGTTVAVLRGEGVFGSPDSALTLTQSQQAEFWRGPGDVRTRYQWVNRSEDAFDRAAAALASEPAPLAAAAVSPEMTGIRELDRYGHWDRHPEYGTVWLPAAVPAGWAPYRFGRWTWVAPWGWTWVDDAPWGFAPFHYGRWVLWLGRWCWMPGAYVARPVWAPALVVWSAPPPPPPPGRFVMVAPPPSVGWAPLPPRDPYRPVYPASPVYVNGINAVTVHPALRPPAALPPGPASPPVRPGEPVMVAPRQMPARVGVPVQQPAPPAGVARPAAPPAAAPPRATGEVRVHPAFGARPPVREPSPAAPAGGGQRRDPRGGNN